MPYFYFAGGVTRGRPHRAPSSCRLHFADIVHCLTIGPAVLFDSASLLWPLSLAPGPSAEPKPAPKKQFVGLWLADVGRKPSVEPKTGFQNKYGISGWQTLAVSKAVNQKPPPTIEFGVSGWLILAVSQAK